MKNKLIFFVDDDKMMLDLMEYTFKCREGFDVKSFYSGEECLEHMHMNPSLIVLDYYLGAGESTIMSGMDTLKKINAMDNPVPVIILSREKNAELIKEFRRAGALKYVIKDDYFINTLIDTIESVFKEKIE